jgi:hypothetical protein
MHSLRPMRSNESPAPTTPIAPTAPVPLLEPLERTVLMQPLKPMQAAQPIKRSTGVSVVERAGQITSLVLGVVEALLITWVVVKLLAAGFGFVVSSTTSLLRLGRPSRRSFRPLRRRTAR